MWRPLGVSNPCCRDENPEKGPQEKDQQGNHYQLSHNSSPELEFFPNWLLSMGLATVIIKAGQIPPHLFYLVPSRTITYYIGRTDRYF
jgi:hypothetical protein